MAHHLSSEVGGALRNGIIGVLGVAGFAEMTRRSVEFGEELVNTSRRLGITIEQLQVLRELAKDNGAEFGSLVRAFEKIDIARQKAFGKSGADTMAAFAALGITPDMLKGPNALTASQLFTGPMHQAATSKSMEDLAPYLKEVLGKGFGELAASLQADASEIEAKMKKLGSIMSAEAAVKLKALADEAGLLSRIIVSQLGPALLKFAEWAYTTALKGGKGVAEASAAAGAGTAKWGIGDWAKAILTGGPASVAALVRNKGNMEAGGEDLASYLGFDMSAAGEAMADAEKPWRDMQEQFAALQKKLEEEANKLNHPIAPTFEEEAASGAASQSQKFVKGKVSELQQIGGYISPMQTSLLDVNKKSERHLASIDKKLDKIGGNSAQEFGGVQH